MRKGEVLFEWNVGRQQRAIPSGLVQYGLSTNEIEELSTGILAHNKPGGGERRRRRKKRECDGEVGPVHTKLGPRQEPNREVSKPPNEGSIPAVTVVGPNKASETSVFSHGRPETKNGKSSTKVTGLAKTRCPAFPRGSGRSKHSLKIPAWRH